MTTPLQAQSNARNAQRSTGPVTGAGKARCAQNARRHGFCAADIVMPGQDGGPFRDLLARTLALWQPQDEEQRELADEIAIATWRRWHLRRAEAELWAVRCGSGPDAEVNLGEAMARDCDTTANAIEKVRRWWQGNERHLRHCVERLSLMQRLAQVGARRPKDAGAPPGSRAFGRFLAAAVDRPLPGQMPDGSFPASPEQTVACAPETRSAPENGKSAEQTQSMLSQAEQELARDAQAAERPVSRSDAPPLSRRERRRIEREQHKRDHKRTD